MRTIRVVPCLLLLALFLPSQEFNSPRVMRPSLSQRQIREIAFLPDSRTMVTGDGQTATVWDTQTGLVRWSVDATAAKVVADGKFVWTESRDPLAQVRRISPDALNGPAIMINTTRTDLMFADAADSLLLYRDRNSGQVQLTATPQAAPASRVADWRALPSGRGSIEAARFNPASQSVAIADFDGKITVYDYAANRVAFETRASGGVITRLVFSADGSRFATLAQPERCLGNLEVFNHLLLGQSDACNFRSTVAVWDSKSGSPLYAAEQEQTLAIQFAPDNHTLAVANAESVRLINLETRSLTRTFPLTLDRATLISGERMVVRLAFSPDGQWLAETSHGPIYLIHLDSGQVVRSLADPTLTHLANSILTRDGRLLSAVLAPDRVVVTELSPGVSIRILKINPLTSSLPPISADGSTIAVRSTDRTIHVWNIPRAEPICAIPMDPPLSDPWRRMDLSADGSELLLPATSGGPGPAFEIWNTRTCRVAARIGAGPASEGSVRFASAAVPARTAPSGPRLAMSPGGRYLAWVTPDNVLRLWNRAAARLEASVRVPVPAIYTELEPAARRPINHHLEAAGNRFPLPTPSDDSAPEGLLRFDQLNAGICGLDFNLDESLLATTDINGQVRLWSTSDGRFVRTLGELTPQSAFVLNGNLRSAYTFGSLAFSPDRRTAASLLFGRPGPATLWNLDTGQALRPLRGFALWTPSAAFTSDGKTIIALGYTSNMLAVDVASGRPLTTISVFGAGQDWLAHTADGLFDGTPAAYRQLGWGDIQSAVPIEAFFGDFYRPGLLPEILSGRRPAAPLNLGRVDRRQAAVRIEPPAGMQSGVPLTTPTTTLRIRAVLPDPAARLRDLRLFRNGSLVHVWRGNLNPGSSGAVEVSADIPLTAGPNQFVAYGFNQDNVQTAKGMLVLDGALSLARKGTAYLLVAGVNQYENRDFNLRYAAGDARIMADRLSEQLKATHRYREVRVVPLLDANATKAKLETALVQLGGGAIDAGAASGLGIARPEDAVFVFFAGHGWARDGRFYLIPHDLGYKGSRAALASDVAAQKAILDHAISDRELSGLLENVDAGLIALIIDACNSGQMLESDDARQGPLNSKGLAQLAWDKGMYILTAAQSYQAALEAQQLQHGYLTYALAEEGLGQRRADRDPEDGEIDIREWFDYAALRVPQMQRERAEQARLLVTAGAPAADVQTPRAFYRYELGRHATIAGMKGAEPLPCSLEPQLKAVSGTQSSLSFENAAPSSASRKLFWLDNAGNRRFFGMLAPGAMATVNTSIGQAWVVTDTTDQCVAIYSSGARRESIVLER